MLAGDLNAGEGFGEDLHGLVDVVFVVGEGDEAGLVGGGGDVDAALEGGPEEFFEEFHVLFHDVVDVADFAVGEVEAEHGADAVDAVGDAFFLHEGAEAGFEVGAELIEAGEAIWPAGGECAELGEAGGHGEGVSREGACLVDGAEGGEHVHDVCTAAEGSDGEAAADDFAEAGEVWGEVFEALDAGFAEAEAGHDFIEDEEGAVLLGDGGEEAEVAGLGEDEAGVGGVGLDDDGGDFLAFFGENFGEGFGFVVGEDDGFFCEGFGDAGGVWLAVGECAGACGDEEGVAVAVVAAVELYDVVALGEAAGEADGGHGGLGAGGGHADFFDGGNPLADRFCHVDFVGVGDAEGDAVFGDLVDGVCDFDGGVAEDVWPP